MEASSPCISMISPIKRWSPTRTTSAMFASFMPSATIKGPATLIILPFFILKKGKFSPENKTSEPKPKSVEEQMLENNKND